MKTVVGKQWLVDEVKLEFQKIGNEGRKLLNENGNTEAADQVGHLLGEQSEKDLLRIVLVGQYNAGKSTIIAALTGKREIRIAADIATDEAKAYKWDNGIEIVDTPGLWTEKTDHDEITNKALLTADLVIFVITSELFNPITVEAFRKMAVEDNLRPKMMLVVNKMLAERGNYEDLRKTYFLSLQGALPQGLLTGIRLAFIDAKHYRRNLHDPKKRAQSHFDDFINQLNEFAKEAGWLGRLDRPVDHLRRILMQAIESASTGQNESDQLHMSLLQRIETRLRRAVEECNHQAGVTLEEKFRAGVVALGAGIANKIVAGEDVTGEVAVANTTIRQLLATTVDEMRQILDEIWDRTKQSLAELGYSDLVETYFKHGDLPSVEVKAPVLTGIWDLHIVGQKIGESALDRLKSSTPILTPSTPALDPTIVSPILEVIQEILPSIQEAARNRKLRDARDSLLSSFNDAAEMGRKHLRSILSRYVQDSYGFMLERIDIQRNDLYKQQATKDKYTKKLYSLIERINFLRKQFLGVVNE